MKDLMAELNPQRVGSGRDYVQGLANYCMSNSGGHVASSLRGITLSIANDQRTQRVVEECTDRSLDRRDAT
jgi:hypothetical protein